MTRHFAYDERWNGAAISQPEWHFHRQLLDRYGIVLGPGDYSHMLDRIRSGKALLVKTVARNRAVYRCRVKSTTEVVFVISDGKWLFTAYPTNKHMRALAQSAEEQRKANRSIE